MARERPPTVVDPSVEPVERWRWPRLKGEKKGRKPKGKGGGEIKQKKIKRKKKRPQRGAGVARFKQNGHVAGHTRPPRRFVASNLTPETKKTKQKQIKSNEKNPPAPRILIEWSN